jgi:hypothetical protein
MSVNNLKPGTTAYSFVVPKPMVAKFLDAWFSSNVSNKGSFEILCCDRIDESKKDRCVVVLSVDFISLEDVQFLKESIFSGPLSSWKDMLVLRKSSRVKSLTSSIVPT